MQTSNLQIYIVKDMLAGLRSPHSMQTSNLQIHTVKTGSNERARLNAERNLGHFYNERPVLGFAVPSVQTSNLPIYIVKADSCERTRIHAERKLAI